MWVQYIYRGKRDNERMIAVVPKPHPFCSEEHCAKKLQHPINYQTNLKKPIGELLCYENGKYCV